MAACSLPVQSQCYLLNSSPVSTIDRYEICEQKLRAYLGNAADYTRLTITDDMCGGYNPIPFQFTTLVPADRRLEPGREEREVSLTCYNADTLTTSPTHRGDIQRQRRKKRPKTILSLPAPETLPTPTSDSSMSSSKKSSS